jgi:hydrogenase nickel incorporation protein HypA/HybF
MHELGVTEGVLKVVLRHAEVSNADRVVSISLKVGELHDIIEEWMQRYFDYVSRGTIAEGAKIIIHQSPATVMCEDCGKAFPINIRKMDKILCPYCSGIKVNLASGRELIIEEIEVI